MVAWSTTDKSANVTLSTAFGLANSLATFTSATQGAVRCDTSTAVKTYVEFWLSAGANWHIGYANATYSLAAILGNTNDSVDANPSGNTRINNGNVGQWGVSYLGCCVGWAFDPIAKLIWVSLNGANWNNSATANPSTGVGGVSIATINAGPYFPTFSAASNGAACIGRFGTNDMAFPIPTGFSAMDTNVQAFEMTPKFVAFALYNIPQAAASVFKEVSYAVLNTPQASANVFKMVSYAILQPPPTNGRFDYNWPLPRYKWPKRRRELQGESEGTNPNLFPGTVAGLPFGTQLNDNFPPRRRRFIESQIPRMGSSQTPQFPYLLFASL